MREPIIVNSPPPFALNSLIEPMVVVSQTMIGKKNHKNVSSPRHQDYRKRHDFHYLSKKTENLDIFKNFRFIEVRTCKYRLELNYEHTDKLYFFKRICRGT